MGVLPLAEDGEIPALPADGVPEHAVAPVPETAIDTDEDRPAPDIVMVPE